MNPQTLLERLHKADELITESMKFWHVPGAAIAIVTKDEVLLSKGYGFRDVAKKLPVTPKTVFPLASITKSFTAMGVALLVDEGKLSWDDKVQTHLPWFRLKDDYAGAHLTIRDLLCHRSGLPRHDLLWYGTNISREEGLRKLAHLELSKGFREEWQYQNIMYTTAGFLAGEVAGSSWEDLTKTRILQPLAMKDSVCGLEFLLKKANRATGYKFRDKTLERRGYRDRLNAGPAGMMCSNITDMVKWLQLHLNQGNYQASPSKVARLVSKKNLAEMHSPQMVVRNSPPIQTLYGSPIDTYGLGWHIRPYQDKVMIEHGGNIDGFSTLASFFPDANVGMIVLANLESTPFRRATTHSLYDLLFDSRDKQWNAVFKKDNDKLKRDADKNKEKSRKSRKKNTKPSHPLKEMAGIYQHPGYADFVVRLRKGKLEGLLAGKFWPMAHYHYDIFEMVFEDDNREKVSFQTGENGSVTMFKFKIESALGPATFTKKTKKSN